MSLRHRIAHLFGRTVGNVEVWWEGEKLMVGFRCAGCGRLDGVHESPRWD